MAKKYLTNLDLNGNVLLNPVLNPLATPPDHANPYYMYQSTASADKGTCYVNVGTYQTPVWQAIGNPDAYVKPLGGIPSIDLSTAVQESLALADSSVQASEVGAANGVAQLDAGGKVPAAQLPSYVDDVIEGYLYNGVFYSDSAHTVVIPAETGKIYVDLTTEKTYRWSGSVYVEISQGVVISRATGTIPTNATSATLYYTGTLINAYARQDSAEVITDMAINSYSVVFSVAEAPSTAVTCVLVYAT